jgi:hypothetical protein
MKNGIKNTERIGEINYNNNGTLMKIISYRKSSDIVVEFQDKYKYTINTTYSNFVRGNISNPYSKSVYGVGYIGIGRHPTHVNKINTYPYIVWKNILARCYYEKERYKYPAYVDCYMCEEWHNFQVFADWYEENYYNVGKGKMHIDKDIIKKDKKIYCPQYCLIVPQRINMIFMSKARKDDLPNSIVQNMSGTYTAYYKKVKCGVGNTIEEAIAEHDKQKRIHIRQVVEEYGNKLPSKVVNALLAW